MSEVANTLLVNRAIISNNNKILLLQRAKEDSHNALVWEFPGGKIDTDEEPIDGLIREVFEETGLTIELSSPLAHVESELITAGKYEGRLYVALFYAAQKLSGDVVLSSEHIAAEWVSTEIAHRYDLSLQSRRALVSLGKLGLIG
jgi:8-oxo-dGTP diphosphatase